MIEQVEPTDLQITVAHLFIKLKASHGYAVAGGAGLLASELISRPTHGLDLFTHAPVVSVKPARDTFLKATHRRGWHVTLPVDTQTFCRMHIVDRDDEVLVDLVIDSPASAPPTMTILGPTLAPLELAGRKLLALFGRAEARDFADVYVLAQRFGKEQLLALAELLDAGFDRPVLAQMIGTLGRFADDEVPLPPQLVGTARRFFASWINDL